MIAKIKAYLAAAGVFLAALFIAVSIGYSKGAASQKQAQHEKTLRSIDKARRVEDEIRGLDSAGLNDRFARWVRE